jgi:hypothetical protein
MPASHGDGAWRLHRAGNMRSRPTAIAFLVGLAISCEDPREAPTTTPGFVGAGGNRPTLGNMLPPSTGAPTSVGVSTATGTTGTATTGATGGEPIISPTTIGAATSSTATGIGGGFK